MLNSRHFALAAAIAIASSASFGPTPIRAQEIARDSGERRIAVSGVGEVAAAPDIAHLTVGASATARTAKAALDQTSDAVAAIMDGLKAAGLAEADIRTVGLSLSPRWERRRRADGSMENVQAGFQARNSLMVTCRDLAKLGELLDQLAKAGANEIGGIKFDIDERASQEDQARRLAVEDAKRKAALLAEQSGASLGAIMQIVEGGRGPIPQPLMRAEMAMAASDAVPVAAGTQTVRIDVSTIWALE